VLNSSPLVSDAKRASVQAAIEKLGYRPSRVAASLAAERTHAVGLVIDDFENPWFVTMLQGLRSVVGPAGFNVAVQEHYRAGGTFVNAIEGFLEARVDALLIAAEPGRNFDQLGIPTVVEGTRLHSVAGADHVMSNQAAGVRLALAHLQSRGHRRIGHVTGAGGAAKGRRDAFLQATELKGEPSRCAGEDNETNEEGGYAGTVELLRRHPEVTAVFAANDTMALGARAALREVGREVPCDAALIGYDNSQLARSRFLDLTTVDNCGFAVGAASGRALLRRLDTPDEPAETTVISPRLVIRSSSGPTR
jgi:DNA-binding LacI/PurR family transcriptional regulator